MPSSDWPAAHPALQGAGLVLLGAWDFLKDGRRWYARRARRKKVLLVRLEARNAGAVPLTVDFPRAVLGQGGRELTPEKGEVVIRKLSTFPWDFLFYWILHLNVIELAVELLLFAGGAFFNRWLRKDLAAILDRPRTLGPGERLQGLIAFSKVGSAEEAELALPWSLEGAGLEWTRGRLD